MGIKLFTVGIKNGDIANKHLTETQIKGFNRVARYCHIIRNNKQVKLDSVNKLLTHVLDTRDTADSNQVVLPPYAILTVYVVSIKRLEYYRDGQLVHDLRDPDLKDMRLKTYAEFMDILSYYAYLRSFGLFNRCEAGSEPETAELIAAREIFEKIRSERGWERNLTV